MIEGEGLKIVLLFGEESLLMNFFHILEWSEGLRLDGGEEPVVDSEQKFEVVEGIDGGTNLVNGSPLLRGSIFNFNRSLEDGDAETRG